MMNTNLFFRTVAAVFVTCISLALTCVGTFVLLNIGLSTRPADIIFGYLTLSAMIIMFLITMRTWEWAACKHLMPEPLGRFTDWMLAFLD